MENQFYTQFDMTAFLFFNSAPFFVHFSAEEIKITESCVDEFIKLFFIILIII